VNPDEPDHEHTDGCICDVPVTPGEETEDEHLPETNLVPGLDKPQPKKRERRK